MKRIKKMLVLKDPHFESLRSKFMCQAPVLYIAEDAGQDRKKGDEDAYLLQIILDDIDDPNRDDASHPIDNNQSVASARLQRPIQDNAGAAAVADSSTLNIERQKTNQTNDSQEGTSAHADNNQVTGSLQNRVSTTLSDNRNEVIARSKPDQKSAQRS